MPTQLAKNSYQTALESIARTYEGARRSVVEAYWKIGREIVELEQDGQVHAQYGEGILKKLSVDLSKKLGSGFSLSNLDNMRRFYLANKILQTSGELTWSNHVQLLRVSDPKKRKTLEKRIVKEGLSNKALRQLIRDEAPVVEVISKPLPPLKPPKDLQLSTYKKSGAFIDCGFFVHRAATAQPRLP
ncbi:MAG: hypothetical protein HQL18_03865 [Candidatus Omnitrophica bacterium]|nr:hypothetical protein [Candidatus Omnitrophota bacterium]